MAFGLRFNLGGAPGTPHNVIDPTPEGLQPMTLPGVDEQGIVATNEAQRANVEAILSRYSGVDASARGTEYRAGGWEDLARALAG